MVTVEAVSGVLYTALAVVGIMLTRCAAVGPVLPDLGAVAEGRAVGLGPQDAVFIGATGTILV